MVFRGGRAFGRLSQLTLPCLENRRIALLPWSSERVLAFHSTSLIRHDSDSKYGSSLFASIARRAYATAKPVSRPKAHTGRTTTSPRKKAAPKTAAAKKPAVAKKPAAKRPAAKKATKPKPKPKPKFKKPKAKPKAKPKTTRKVLTDTQKAKLSATKERLSLKNLRELALTPPPALRATAYMVFHGEAIKEADTSKGVAAVTKAAAAKYKNLTPEQLEHYNHIANQNKAENQSNYRKWVESYTPNQIRLANKARLSLKKRSKNGKGLSPLKDERQVKSYLTPFLCFYQDRMKSGDFHGIKISEASRLAAREWKALSADESKKYKDMAAQDMARYEQEQKAVYNRDVVHHKPASSS